MGEPRCFYAFAWECDHLGQLLNAEGKEIRREEVKLIEKIKEIANYINNPRFVGVAVGIDDSFFVVTHLEDYFFTDSVETARNVISQQNAEGIYDNVIFSSALSNPTAIVETSGRRGGGGGGSMEVTTFAIGDEVEEYDQ